MARTNKNTDTTIDRSETGPRTSTFEASFTCDIYNPSFFKIKKPP
jgi:hypothetical protein